MKYAALPGAAQLPPSSPPVDHHCYRYNADFWVRCQLVLDEYLTGSTLADVARFAAAKRGSRLCAQTTHSVLFASGWE
jgi:hypothetical protein